jgi:S-adenosylmethionine hydrolase
VPRPVVTFLSDFGAGSGFPAQMKGEVLRRLPDATLVDLSHEVAPFDVLAGALLLEACVPRFPLAAVHLAVVDPGVGTARRPICVVDGEGRRLVGPDNGLFTPFLAPGGRAFLLADSAIVPRDPSPTFHGRDLFAPVAAWLAGGGDAGRLGPRLEDPVALAWPVPRRTADGLEGECLVADPFGNLVTSLRRADLAGADVLDVTAGGLPARWVETFGQGAPGELLALWGSGDRLEIAVREGSAARATGFARGAPVRLRFRRRSAS